MKIFVGVGQKVMKSCPLCGYSKAESILKKRAIPIFTNAPDKFQEDFETYRCDLDQCVKCGHVFQHISENLKIALEKIYKSEHAQITTPLGVGNWGRERAPYLFEKLKRIDKYKKNISVLEIGCGNGYVLKTLKEMGFQNLIGIEPSLKKTERVNGILFIKEFVSKELELHKRFDFIFSIGVYEHIEDIDNITSFSKRYLNPDGELFTFVPNCEKSFVTGDPGIFVHEHLQYFVENSFKYHLSKHGFGVIENQSDHHALAIYAKETKEISNREDVTPYDSYKKKVDNKLKEISNTLRNGNLIVHGACNALNNILGWLGRDFNFILADNDNTKHGKMFFNKKVQPISAVDLASFDTVLIIPTFFSEPIKAAYRKAGFHGQFKTAD